jgi:F-type H+-transporting ATPase subunit b
MIDINYSILIVQAVSFLLAVSILWKIGWKPLTTFLINRRKKIEEDINDAKASRENAIKLEDEFKKKIAHIENQAREILSDAAIDGKKNKEGIIKTAQEEAKKAIEKAKVEIEKEKEAAKKELQNEVASLAVMLSEKILKESITKKTHEKIINDFIKEIKK